MSHDHHEHCCEHEKLKYCKVCRVVYCKDCKTEWKEHGWVYTYPWTYTVSSPEWDAIGSKTVSSRTIACGIASGTTTVRGPCNH